jgi:hypothetical protein
MEDVMSAADRRIGLKLVTPITPDDFEEISRIWATQLPKGPRCLFCEQEWLDELDDPPPACYVALFPDDDNDDLECLHIAPICERCDRGLWRSDPEQLSLEAAEVIAERGLPNFPI